MSEIIQLGLFATALVAFFGGWIAGRIVQRAQAAKLATFALEPKDTPEGARLIGQLEGLEEARLLCVRRMTAWTADDDSKPHAFREGIARACSDVAQRLAETSKRRAGL